jgi:RNA polymerase sigma-70 factor (ECF subfamily)
MQVDVDAEDWAGVLRGDGEAFGRIFDRRREQVRRQAHRLLDGRLDVEDAVAIVFLEAWRKRSSVRVVDGSVLPWLLVTTMHVARNIRRGRSRYDGLLTRLPAASTAPDPASAVDDREVLTAMRKLSLVDQQVLTLCVLEGWSERDAAAALAVAPGTVKSRLHRAKQRLAQRVDRRTGTTHGRGVSDGA